MGWLGGVGHRRGGGQVGGFGDGDGRTRRSRPVSRSPREERRDRMLRCALWLSYPCLGTVQLLYERFPAVSNRCSRSVESGSWPVRAILRFCASGNLRVG